MRLHPFLASFPLPIIAVDSRRRVALWNAAAERLLGWSASEVIGGEDPSIPPEVAAEHKTLWEAALRGEPAVQRESSRVTRSGNTLDVVITTSSVPADEGQELVALMMLRDVTEERAAEERLIERGNQLRTMLEQSPAIVSTFDRDLVFTSAQGAGLSSLGLGEKDFVGRKLSDLIGETAAPVASLRAALRGESSENLYEFRGRWYENRARPLRRRDGSIIGAVNMGFDVTERLQAEAALRESREHLRRLSAGMNKLQEDERRRIARELHDELGQLLTALRLELSVVEPGEEWNQKIAGMMHLVDDVLETVRRVARELRPAILDDFGLRPAVENDVTAFRKRTGIDVRLSIRGDKLIGGDHASAVYRIVQEGLTNVARHSGATAVDLRIDAGEGRVEVELRDNGRGITAAQANGPDTLGLLGLCERAYALGGEATIEGIPNDGTRVFVSLPL